MSKYVYPEDRLPNPGNKKLLALVGENKRVLEVGCALGFQTRSMREIQHCQVTGIEIDPSAADHAREFCEQLIIGDIEAVDLVKELNDKRFDVITFADVLEHLKDPKSVLTKVKQFLKPGGYVVASIPNITHCAVVYEMARGAFEYRALGLLDDTHIRFFTRHSIYSTFEAAGYQVVSLDRNCTAAHETEFKTTPETEADRQLIEYVKQHNPEAETYQFIIKAVQLEDTSACQAELIAAQEQARLLKLEAELYKKRGDELESNLAWIKSQPGYKLFSSLKRIIKR